MRLFGEWMAQRRPGLGHFAWGTGRADMLAMTGRRSPWSGGGTPPPGEDGEGGEAAPPPASGDGTPGAPGPGREPGGGGPRTPWGAPGEGSHRPVGIEELFRPRRGGPGGGPGWHLPERPGGKSWFPLLAAGLAGLWLLTTSCHQLGSTEQGVVTTFGRYTGTLGPGFNLTLPWPFQSVAVTDVTSIRRISIPEGDTEKLMLTSDQSLVDLSYLVRWNIKNLKLYRFQLDDPEGTVREVAEAAMRASVAEVKLNDVMGGAGRAGIETNVRERMQQILDSYRAGVVILGVDIKKADPPAKVNDAFQKVSAAQQDANRDMSNAQAYAQQLIAQAQADAARFDKVYVQYKLAPEVTKRRMYYETMESVLSNNDKVVAPGNFTSYLPLPQMKRRQSDDASAAPGQP